MQQIEIIRRTIKKACFQGAYPFLVIFYSIPRVWSFYHAPTHSENFLPWRETRSFQYKKEGEKKSPSFLEYFDMIKSNGPFLWVSALKKLEINSNHTGAWTK